MGEHNSEILRELGYGQAGIDSLIEEGALGSERYGDEAKGMAQTG